MKVAACEIGLDVGLNQCAIDASVNLQRECWLMPAPVIHHGNGPIRDADLIRLLPYSATGRGLASGNKFVGYLLSGPTVRT